MKLPSEPMAAMPSAPAAQWPRMEPTMPPTMMATMKLMDCALLGEVCAGLDGRRDGNTAAVSPAGQCILPATGAPAQGRADDDDPDDRAADGPGAAPAHVPPDGQDPRLRGAGERALQGREDAGPGPSLRRRG